MKALNLAGAVAVALTFGATVALAQPHIGDGSNTKTISPTTPGYSVGTGSAHIGDGSNYKPVPSTTPGYSIGTSSAHAGHSAHAAHGKNLKPASAKKKSAGN